MAGGTRKETRVVEIRVDSKQFKAATRSINQGLKGIQKEARSMGNSLRAAFAAIGIHEVTRWSRELTMAMANVERADNVLRGAAGNQEDFARALDFTRETAEEFGLNMLLLEEGYAHFMAAGKQVGLGLNEIEKAFEGLSISAAAFQVSGTELQLMLQGARQLMGSTTVNMEDLRQVTERLPGSIGAAVDAVREMTGDLDLTGQEMRKLIAEGKIATDQFFPLFTQRLEEMNFEAAEINSTSFRASLERLNNSLSELLRVLVEQGLLDAIADAVDYLSDAADAAGDFLQAVSRNQGLQDLIGLMDRFNSALESVLAKSDSARNFFSMITNPYAYFGGAAARGIGFLIDDLKEMETMWESHPAFVGPLEEMVGPEQPLALPSVVVAPGAPSGSPLGGGRGAASAGSFRDIQAEAERAAQELADLREETLDLQSAWDPLYDLQKEFAEGMDLIAEATERGAISMDENIAISEKFIEHMTAKMDALSESTKDLDKVAEDLADTFVDAFDAMIFGGESFSDVLRSLERQLINMVAQNLFFEPLSNALAGSDLFGWVASAVAPRQFGGPVEANTPYLVGERGTELFIPSQSGTVVSNEDLIGSGPNGVSVVMNFNGPVSGEGLRQSASQLAAQVGAQTQRALFRNG